MVAAEQPHTLVVAAEQRQDSVGRAWAAGRAEVHSRLPSSERTANCGPSSRVTLMTARGRPSVSSIKRAGLPPGSAHESLGRPWPSINERYGVPSGWSEQKRRGGP